MGAPSLLPASITSRYSPAEIDLAIKNLTPREKLRFRDALFKKEWNQIDAACGADALYWMQNHTLTENEKWQEQGAEFKAAFPRKDYFVPVFRALRTERRLFICKTREMLTSWCVVGHGANRAQWWKACVVIQTLAEEKAKKLVRYARILYENQPEELKHRHPLIKDTELHLGWADGGEIFGIPKGEDQIRMYHPTIAIFDEAAFLPEFQACYDATHPVAGQVIAVSSAGPSFFGDQCTMPPEV